MTPSYGSKGKGGLRVAFLFFLFALSVLASGKHYQFVIGFLRVAVFLAAGAWLWRHGRSRLDVPHYALLLAGFSLLSIGHAFSSVYVWASLQHALNILLAAILLGGAVAVFHGESKPSAWTVFLGILAALAATETSLAAYQRITAGTTRPHGTFSNPMFLSEFLAVAALLCAARFLKEWGKAGQRRIAWGVGAALFLAGALSLTGSRGVLVALVPALIVLVVSLYGVARGAKAILLILPGLAVLGWYTLPRFFAPDVYNYGRWVLWRTALRVFASLPFGVGLGGYKYHWFAAQEPFPQAFRHYMKSAVTPHNEYLEVLTGLGFPGLLLFLAVLLLPLWYAVRGWKGVPEDRRWIAAGALSGLVLTGTNAFFNFNFHEFGVVFTDVLLLGALLACLPDSAFGKRVAIPQYLSKAGAVFIVLLGLVSASLLGGAISLLRGETLVREKGYAAAEKSFRTAMSLDPLRATIPDALSALYYRRFVTVMGAEGPQAAQLLLTSILWQERARDLCPMEQLYYYRLSDLYLKKHYIGGERRDLETVLVLAGEILKINPYGVEAMWNQSEAYLSVGRTSEAVAALQRAVSVEPNFCRAYAKLAELTEGTDEPQARALEARAEACREAAKKRVLEESERWLVVEPGISTQ